MTEPVILNPIGIVHSELKQRYETPRQGILEKGTESYIALYPGKNYEQAVKDLEGFDRIWIIYLFHLNKNWKPLVTPPRFRERKIGLFATRAPHRPNQIGLSCVKLEKVEGLKIFVTESDMLDGSPVLDIKPYLPFSDSFPGAKTGWVLTDPDKIYEVTFNQNARIKAEEIKNSEGTNLISYSKLQLEFTPADTSRKRISKYGISEDLYTLTYRQWKLLFMVNEKDKKVLITDIIP